eukprot:CAMPEP_0175225038 /NCGR_PEP_ID=MMETSP0093-20121207/22164_1 /TAXON_ID=311494 /ORGANISM="Alexandrium monilatum, Strain CCMP3105" /LENGTH=39 /DNA_ID= /DNA_START= /DNA_END= /DNA_ORIENTATION=
MRLHRRPWPASSLRHEERTAGGHECGGSQERREGGAAAA